MHRLDGDNPIPLYYQLFSQLRDAISSGVYAHGTLLPSEAQLEKQFGVSRITVRRALDELRLRNFVVREKGRGTRVVNRASMSPSIIGSVEGMLENNLAMGLETEVKVLDFDYVSASEQVAEQLKIEAGTIVQRSTRVRSYEGTPFSFLETFIPADIGRRLNREDMSAGPLLLLLEKIGIKIETASQIIGAENASPVVARYLRVEPGTALLRIERTACDSEDRPVQHIVALYLPAMYSYRMKLQRKSEERRMQWSPLS